MTNKSLRSCFATSYRWAIAGGVGAAFSGFDLPSVNTFIDHPLIGSAVMAVLVIILGAIVFAGALLEYLVSMYIAPNSESHSR
jgi:hypothetical protein